MAHSMVAAWLALAGWLSGCGPHLTWTRSAPSQKRPSGCSFDVLGAVSLRPALVVGVIDLDAFSVRSLPRNDAELRARIRDKVCRVGGDAVVPAITGDGRYVLATVLKYTGDAPPPCEIRSEPASAAGQSESGAEAPSEGSLR